MRLTLRTLLAYLDDVLDPADREQLSQKIESSEFAKDLVHRSRDTMRRLRLSAPQVVGSGMGLDPNTVAEYLDNALPPEQVGDFERICLESDVHLAEAAACHHVLTMVFGEPAEVDPRARQRMYQLPAEARERRRHRVEPAHVAGMSSAVVAAGLPLSTIAGLPARSVAQAQPARAGELPEYLRTRPWWRSGGALATVTVLGLAAIGFSVVRGMQERTGDSMASLTPPNTLQAAVPLASVMPMPAGENGGGVTPPAANSEPVDAPNNPTADVAYDSTPAPSGPEIVPAPTLPQPAPGNAIAPQSPDRQAETTSNVSAAGPFDMPPENQLPAVSSPIATAGPNDVPDTPSSSVVAVATNPPPSPDTISGALATRASSATSPPPSPDQATSGPIELGTYLGPKTVLARYDEKKDTWFRIETRQPVLAGERLVALPEFRPTIALASGVHFDMTGGTQIALLTADALPVGGLSAAGSDVPAIDVVYGRVILSNRSNRDNQVRLKLGENIADVRLARNATLAIEMERQYVPGTDPRKTAAPVVVRLFAPEGGIEWQDATGKRLAPAAAQWKVDGGVSSEPSVGAKMPDWLEHDPTGNTPAQQLAVLAATKLESSLVSNRPLDVQLLELYQSNMRPEVKSLAARASVHVGLCDPFVSALADPAQRLPMWKTSVQTLRSVMALSAQAADKVWQTLVQQRGEAAGDLYEMLCGYGPDQVGRTPEQWKTGALRKLIDWLEDDSLDYRVLALYNLTEITGKQLNFDPPGKPREREQSVKVWRLRLERGELRPQSATESTGRSAEPKRPAASKTTTPPTSDGGEEK